MCLNLLYTNKLKTVTYFLLFLVCTVCSFSTYSIFRNTSTYVPHRAFGVYALLPVLELFIVATTHSPLQTTLIIRFFCYEKIDTRKFITCSLFALSLLKRNCCMDAVRYNTTRDMRTGAGSSLSFAVFGSSLQEI